MSVVVFAVVFDVGLAVGVVLRALIVAPMLEYSQPLSFPLPGGHQELCIMVPHRGKQSPQTGPTRQPLAPPLRKHNGGRGPVEILRLDGAAPAVTRR